jgi:hypothetical protein
MIGYGHGGHIIIYRLFIKGLDGGCPVQEGKLRMAMKMREFHSHKDAGCRLLVTGYWLARRSYETHEVAKAGYRLLVTGYWLLVTGYWLLNSNRTSNFTLEDIIFKEIGWNL